MHQIASITGHASMREVLRYTKGVNQAKLALQAVHLVEVANPRTNGKHRSG
jgi:hypothetical protein